MKQYIRSSMLVLLITLVMPVNAQSSESLTTASNTQLLAAAMASSQRKLSTFLATHWLAFTREKVDRDGEVESYRYTPSEGTNGKWSKVDTEYSTNRHESKVWESNIFFSPENFHLNQASLLEENETALIFAMPVSLDLTVDSDKVDHKQQDKVTFSAHVELDKASQQITSYKIFSVKKFSPQFGVSVKSFQSFNKLTPLFADGPLVVSEQLESIRGDFGLFISIDEDTKTRNFDFSWQSITQ